MHVISRHLGWGKTLSEGVRVVDALFNGQQLLRGGQRRVGVHDPFHAGIPTTICLSWGTKERRRHIIFNWHPRIQKTAHPLLVVSNVYGSHGMVAHSPPEQVTQEDTSQNPACYSVYLLKLSFDSFMHSCSLRG